MPLKDGGFNLEGCIAALNADGWLVGSLCQLAIGDWYVCLIDSAGFTYTATAATPLDAIEVAHLNPPGRRVWSRVDGHYADEDDIKIDLVALGLIKPKPKLNRRF